MKKYGFVAGMLATITLICFILTSFFVKSENGRKKEDETLIVTSFYPMYIAALNIVGDTEGIRLENLSEPQTGCLHDFQLTPEDMKLLSQADMFLINGGGIEGFMADVAASYPELVIVEACRDISLLEEEGEHEHGEHEHEENEPGEEFNAHAWMNVTDYRIMVASITDQFCQADPLHASLFRENAEIYDQKLAELENRQEQVALKFAAQKLTKVILFHEAYAYVADAMHVEVCATMDLDEERQISAGEVSDILETIDEDQVSLILAEELYGADMANLVKGEREINVLFLNPLNRGEYAADAYLKGMEENMNLLESVLD